MIEVVKPANAVVYAARCPICGGLWFCSEKEFKNYTIGCSRCNKTCNTRAIGIATDEDLCIICAIQEKCPKFMERENERLMNPYNDHKVHSCEDFITVEEDIVSEVKENDGRG